MQNIFFWFVLIHSNTEAALSGIYDDDKFGIVS